MLTLSCDTCLQYYELRFPRLTKPTRSPDSGASPLSLDKLQLVAQEAVGAAPSTAAALVDHIWNAAVRDAAIGSLSEQETSGAGLDSQEKYDREVRGWVERLEKADGVLDGEASTTLVRRRGGDEATREKKRARVDKRVSGSSSTRATSPTVEPPQGPNAARLAPPAPTTAAFDTARVPPAASPPPHASSALLRSLSSPCARSSAPSPSQRLRAPAKEPPMQGAKRAPLASTVSCPALHASKKRRKSSSTSSRASLSSALTTLLSPLSPSSSLASAGDTAVSYPSRAFAWSVYPPLRPGTPVPVPRHPFLDDSNFLASPLSVLWVAGLAPASLASSAGAAGAGTRRQGFVFVAPGATVERECVGWLEGEVRKEGGEVVKGGETQVVWVVKDEALDACGLWDLGRGGEVLTVL